jgi:hypothetical protein
MAETSTTAPAPEPPKWETVLDPKWDAALDIALRRVVYGAAAGAAAALVLLRECRRGGRGARTSQERGNGWNLSPLLIAHLPPPTAAGSPTARVAAVTFGAGCGAGSAYQTSQALVSALPSCCSTDRRARRN